MKLTGVPDIKCHVLTSPSPSKWKNKSPSLHQQTLRPEKAALVTHWEGMYAKAFELFRI